MTLSVSCKHLVLSFSKSIFRINDPAELPIATLICPRARDASKSGFTTSPDASIFSNSSLCVADSHALRVLPRPRQSVLPSSRCTRHPQQSEEWQQHHVRDGDWSVAVCSCIYSGKQYLRGRKCKCQYFGCKCTNVNAIPQIFVA